MRVRKKAISEFPPRVLQLVDSLALGGLERVAVDLANGLSDDGSSCLCSTRASGPLEYEIHHDVATLALERRSRWDLSAVRKCVEWAQEQGVEILHAHGSSLLFANLLLLRWPGKGRNRPRLVWHDHFGRFATENRSRTLYRLLTARVDAVLSVNQDLRRWAIDQLGLSETRCVYIPNSVDVEKYQRAVERAKNPSVSSATKDGNGSPLKIVCLANLRAQKNHSLLFEALTLILAKHSTPPIKLILVGSSPEPKTARELHTMAADPKLAEFVEFLGERSDVPDILATADIGVLSSSSEGLPLALLEYGAASLPVVCTAVGQIPEVLQGSKGPAGVLVSPSSARELADGLLQLINEPDTRRRLGQRLHNRVVTNFSQRATLEAVRAAYQSLGA